MEVDEESISANGSKPALTMPEEEMQAKAYLCHTAAAEILQPIAHLVDLIFSIAPSAHSAYPASHPANTKLLTYDSNDIKKVAYAYSMAAHIALYEPSKQQVRQIFGQLQNASCRCYVFSLLDADYGIDSAPLSFAKKYGKHNAHKLSHITLAGQHSIGNKQWVVYCALYQPNMPKEPLNLSISLSPALALPECSLLFSFHVLGTVGVLPEDALQVFMNLGMTIQHLKGDGPIKVFSDRTVFFQRFRVSWHPKSPLSVPTTLQVITHIKHLYQKANLPGNYGELQVLINFPVFAHEQPSDYCYIDVPWSPNFYQPQQTRLIHETLRASEIPHAFHKFGLPYLH